MKKLIFLSSLALACFFTDAQPITTPQASTTQSVKQNFSTGHINLEYSRPSMKGRKIYGDLVPFGKVWRTGANAATTIEFSEDVTIGGKEVKAGKYGLLTIPAATDWTIILTKDTEVTSPADYKQENDVVRVMAKPVALPMPVETFTIMFANITGSSADLQLLWDKTLVNLPISSNTDSRVMAQIDKVMNKDNKPYYQAAQYYYDNNKDLTQAAAWADKAIAANPEAFWITLLKARILAKSGDKTGAKAAANKTIELATKAKNDDYVKMANDLVKTL